MCDWLGRYARLPSPYDWSRTHRQLYLSPGTVKSHVSHTLIKLGPRDRVQAVMLAYETGIIAAGSDKLTNPFPSATDLPDGVVAASPAVIPGVDVKGLHIAPGCWLELARARFGTGPVALV
jgi:hypothetical protein